MDRQLGNSLNLQAVRAHMTRYSRDVHPIVLQHAGSEELRHDELESIYDALQQLHASLARDLAILQFYLKQSLDLSPGVSVIEVFDKEAPVFIHKLSEKEQEVLTMFAKGCSYTEAAELLDCKLATIQTHAKRIYKKLNVHSRSEAIFEARQLGMIQL